MNFEFIIIGSGIGGLVSGIILAKEGHSVCVLEKNHQAGGNLQTFTRNGHTFSTGLHYIGSMGEGQTLHRFFKYLGITDKLKLKQLETEGYDRLHFGDDETPYYHSQGWENFGESLKNQFPGEKSAIDKYITTVRKSIDSIPLYNLETAASPNLDLNNISGCAVSFLQSITDNRRLISVLAGGNSIYHGAAQRTPFYLHSCIRNSFVNSAWKIGGGSGRLVEVLLETLTAHGGKVVTDAEVTAFTANDGKIDGVILKDGRKFSGKNFISNMHPATTLQLDGLDRLPNVYRKRITGLENSAGFFSLYLVFKENFFPYLNYNFFHYNDDDYFEDRLPDESWPHTFILYTPFYEDGMKYSRTASVLSFMKKDFYKKWIGLPAAERGPDYAEFKEMMTEKLLEAVEKRFPLIRQGIEQHFVSTPLTFADFTGSPDGTGYGILKDCTDPLRSIVIPRTKIPNLYFTGQNLNVHGIVGTTISAVVTCSEIIGFKNLVNKIIHA